PGGGQQFEGGLLDHVAGRVDQHQYFCHDLASLRAQTSFRDARNSAILTPPSPSSTTTCPAWRGGATANSTTSVEAAAKPNSSASRSRSATVNVLTGFDFAAMIPLNDGYRGSLIFSTTLITAGRRPRTTSYPSLDSRSIDTLSPSTVTLRAWESCGTSSTSANMAGTTDIRESVASEPATTTSHSSVPSAAASTFVV